MTKLTTVAVCQLAPVMGRLDESLARMTDAVTRAVTQGANVVVLPELANCGYMWEGPAELRAAAEPVDGPTVRHLEDLAREHGIVIVCGFAEAGDDGAVYNSAVLVDASGVRSTYRKAHLWDHEKPSGFTPGDAAPEVVDTVFGRIGVMICYDLEFPEWVRLAALDGAQLLAAPTNWPLAKRPASERPGEVIRVQADAAVNRMFIAAADRTGTERGQDWIGGSVIMNVDGYPETGLRLGSEAVLVATLDLSEADDKTFSAHNDAFADRRPELYLGVSRATESS